MEANKSRLKKQSPTRVLKSVFPQIMELYNNYGINVIPDVGSQANMKLTTTLRLNLPDGDKFIHGVTPNAVMVNWSDACTELDNLLTIYFDIVSYNINGNFRYLTIKQSNSNNH